MAEKTEDMQSSVNLRGSHSTVTEQRSVGYETPTIALADINCVPVSSLETLAIAIV